MDREGKILVTICLITLAAIFYGFASRATVPGPASAIVFLWGVIMTGCAAFAIGTSEKRRFERELKTPPKVSGSQCQANG